MRFRQIADRVSWPLCLVIVFALVLLHQWYFAAGYLTYGDFSVNHPNTMLPDAFHLWTFSNDLGRADATTWWHRAFIGALFSIHVDEHFAERLVWLYFAPPLFIAGLFVLAYTLVQDRTAAGVAALAGFLNVDFLVRLVGGHDTILMAIAFAPWILVGVIRTVRTGLPGWLAFTTLTTAIATAYDARWVLPVAVIVTVLAIADVANGGSYRVGRRLLAIGACGLGVILPNMPWLVASLGTRLAVSPVPPQSYENAIWVGRLSYATFVDALAIWNPTFGSNFDRGPFEVWHMPLWGVLFVVLVVSSLVLSRRRLALLFFALYLMGAMLYAGSQPPFGSAYLWLFKHVPLFNLYREPLKFGAAASLCASIVLAYGVAALPVRSVRRVLFTLVTCAVIVSLAWPVFQKPGMLAARVPPPADAFVQRIITNDPDFSRILWLPQHSRWISGTPLHPVADGAALGTSDWTSFRVQRGLDDDATDYVSSPLFAQLLRWAAFRYVAVDCSTEVDATLRSDSFSCVHILNELQSRNEFERVFASEGLTVFRLRGAVAPPLWSSRDAILANGSPLSLNAGALTGAFSVRTPVILAEKNTSTIPFGRLQLFDIGARPAPHPITLDRIIGADSIDYGPSIGDAVIQRRVNVRHALQLHRTAHGQSTVAYDGTLEGTVPTLPHAIRQKPSGAVLAAAGEKFRLDGDSQWGLVTGKFSIPVYEKPALRVRADQVSGNGVLVPVFGLEGPVAGRNYALVGPPFQQSRVPAAEIDIRDWLFRTIVANRAYDQTLGLNDGFDRLSLTRIWLLQKSGAKHAALKFSLAVRARAPANGYPVRSVAVFSSSAFSCNCTKHVQPKQSEFAFTRFGGSRRGWMREVVAIHANPISYSGLIIDQDKNGVRGVSTAGNQEFFVKRSQITKIEPAPDAALIDLHVATRATGILVLHGTMDPRARAQLLFAVHSRKGIDWIVKDIPSDQSRPFDVRADLLADVRLAGYTGIDDAMLLLKYRVPTDTSRVSLSLSDAAVVTDERGASARSTLTIGKEEVRSNLAAGVVPVAVRLSTPNGIPEDVAIHRILPSTRVMFHNDTGHKWLIFSQRYDPGWTVNDALGHPVRAVHLRAYGFLNAWFIPAGLHGSYQIAYLADSYARLGATITLLVAAGCAALALTLLSAPIAGVRPSQSEKKR